MTSVEMPDGISRYDIKKADGTSIGTFVEATSGALDFQTWLNGATNLNTLVKAGETALVAAGPYVDVTTHETQWFIVQEGTIINDATLQKNNLGDNCLVVIDDTGTPHIVPIQVTEWSSTITAKNSADQALIDKVMVPENKYSAFQQAIIMADGEKACKTYGQKDATLARWYRFLVETYAWTFGVVDFKDAITINDAITIMKANKIKNASYLDILSYKMYMGDKTWNISTRKEVSSAWEKSNYTTNTDLTIPNKNVIILRNKQKIS